jgi:hypothetical protein
LSKTFNVSSVFMEEIKSDLCNYKIEIKKQSMGYLLKIWFFNKSELVSMNRMNECKIAHIKCLD